MTPSQSRKKKVVRVPIKFKCSCGAKFRWLSGAQNHLKRTRKGQHSIMNVTGQYVEGLRV